VALSTPVFVWTAGIGKGPPVDEFESGPTFGPYSIDIRLEYAVFVAAAVGAVLGLARLVQASVKGFFDLQGWMVVAFAAAAGSWQCAEAGA